MHMTDLTSYNQQLALREKLIAGGAYDPRDEHDACGVGLVASMDGTPKRDIVEMAIRALKAVWHRGAVDADGKTGDGAGIRLDIPQGFFAREVSETGHKPADAPICVGQMFLPRTDLGAQERARSMVEAEILRDGLYIYGWRQPPIDITIIGEKANAARPQIEQILFYDPKKRPIEEIERVLYLCRRRIEKRAGDEGIPAFYVCSLSSQSIIYKGMFLAEDIDRFFHDLRDEEFVSSVAIYHQRYSTNTFPAWQLAQPFRMLAHNGEINTVEGNTNWMKSHEIRMISENFGEDQDYLRPVIAPGASDSAALDSVFELLVRAGRSAPMAKAMLIPEAWSKRAQLLPKSHRALYEYCNSVIEPWDGPAAICGFDGRWAVAGLDRNGLRPLRYAITQSGVLAVGSEAGMCPLDDETITTKGRVGPGQVIAVDLETGEFFEHEAITDKLAASEPIEKWLKKVVELDDEIGPGPEPRLYDRQELLRRQTAAGFSMEDLELILAPMAEEGKEAVGSMGDDSPLAVLSDRYRPLSHYFRQNFAQVTNPPIDPLREEKVMSLKTRFKNLGNILSDGGQGDYVGVLDSPVLSNGMYDRLIAHFKDTDVTTLDCTFGASEGLEAAGDRLQAAIAELCEEAEVAVRSGQETIVLTDEYQNSDKAPIPMILAVGAVHSHLVKSGLRTYCSLVVRSAECLDTHYYAVLVGVGATFVNAYLAQEALADRHERGLFGDKSIGEVCVGYIAAVEGGLLKILSKMGISVISSYRGGYCFEALGLSRALVDAYFPGLKSRISGIGLSGLARQALKLHAKAWDEQVISLPVGGFYRLRHSGERHALDGPLIHMLQAACDTNKYSLFQKYSEALGQNPPIQIRDLLDFQSKEKALEVSDVQSVNEIRKRFVTPGMSLGALSPEAHGALNIAMNRIGAKSVSGEGGEDRARYKPLPNGDNPNSAVKQIASGRFGVTAEYLNQCREIEIKVAQGAKPGEGGQLPGFKVTDMIAKFRHSTPGVMLISPPPHHDIYSIEDLAQLIYDLKQINPKARVCVKLVSRSGVGTVAAGVAKAKADVILIAGNCGGTGASPQTSIKHAGLPWEIGLAEAHQVLAMNNLRHSVTLRTDGGLRRGRDIVMAAMLGAEEYGIGTASLVAMGCIMVRQCHSNTCPVGVCTQDESLRQKFTGTPDKVVNLMSFIAQEVREILAELGFSSLDEVIGRTDLLAQVSRGAAHLDDLDLNALLIEATTDRPIQYNPRHRNDVPDTLDAQMLKDAEPFFERGEKMQLDYQVRNTQRAIGARASSEIVRKFGAEAVEKDRLWVNLRGSAGQSLGVFGAKGLTLNVIGDANDYVGKGLSGATIILRPDSREIFNPKDNTIIGNTCLYGATSGYLYAAGQAAERFAVRNSGAEAVIEGAGSNACEYMTGGQVIVLGEVGDNFGAGMTGGMAFLYDPHKRFEDVVNPDSLTWAPIRSAHWENVLRQKIERHAKYTQSALAAQLLNHWDDVKSDFIQIVPKEVLQRVEHPLDDNEVQQKTA